MLRVHKYDPGLYNSLVASNRQRDSIYQARIDGKALELQKRYESEKKEQQLEIQALELANEKRKSQTRLYIGTGVSFLLILIVIGVFLLFHYRRNIQKLKNAAALEAERSLISKVLHDNVGAQLTSISMRVNLIQHKMSYNPPVPELEKIKVEAVLCVDVLRDTIWAIEQDVFELNNFMERIETYVKRILPEGIHCVVLNKVNGPFELDSFTALNLFRIIQEALQNVMKHSGADRVKICFSVTPALIVSIRDNGVGAGDINDDKTSHYGLNNMRERVKDMGAKLHIEPGTNSGFRLQIAF